MKFFILIIFINSILFAAKPLPNWIDLAREKSDGKPPFILRSAPPPSDFRLVAEYEPVSGVLLGWTGDIDIISQIAEFVTNEGKTKIFVASSPDSIPHIDYNMLTTLNCPLDSIWIRDYGPFGILSNSGKLGTVDAIYRHYQYRRNDDQFPNCFSKLEGTAYYGLDLIIDGGNIMVDTKGNLFTSLRTYIWNKGKTLEQVNTTLKQYYNVKTIHTLPYAGYPEDPKDGTGHIDMFAKLLNDETVLISTSDTEPFKTNGNKAIEYFSKIKTPSGKSYNIKTIKGYYEDDTWYTYTNSLIVNKLVLIPNYNLKKTANDEATKVYQEALPGYLIKGIPSDDIITSGGSIHCVTQTIPGTI